MPAFVLYREIELPCLPSCLWKTWGFRPFHLCWSSDRSRASLMCSVASTKHSKRRTETYPPLALQAALPEQQHSCLEYDSIPCQPELHQVHSIWRLWSQPYWSRIVCQHNRNTRTGLDRFQWRCSMWDHGRLSIQSAVAVRLFLLLRPHLEAMVQLLELPNESWSVYRCCIRQFRGELQRETYYRLQLFYWNAVHWLWRF